MKKRAFKNVVVRMIFWAVFCTIFLSPFTVKASHKYKVKEKYANDVGKSFKSLSSKYGWKSEDGNAGSNLLFSYQVPRYDIWYVFEGDIDSWSVEPDSKCIRISSTELANLVKGLKKDMSVSDFTKSIYSNKKAVSHKQVSADPYSSYNFYGGDDGYYESIEFVTKKGKTRYLTVDVSDPDLSIIKRNAFATINM